MHICMVRYSHLDAMQPLCLFVPRDADAASFLDKCFDCEVQFDLQPEVVPHAQRCLDVAGSAIDVAGCGLSVRDKIWRGLR